MGDNACRFDVNNKDSEFCIFPLLHFVKLKIVNGFKSFIVSCHFRWIN